MVSKLARLTPKEVVEILHEYGFQLVSQKGSHQKWRHVALGKQVIVPMHTDVLPIGTLNSIIKGSGIPKSHWLK